MEEKERKEKKKGEKCLKPQICGELYETKVTASNFLSLSLSSSFFFQKKISSQNFPKKKSCQSMGMWFTWHCIDVTQCLFVTSHNMKDDLVCHLIHFCVLCLFGAAFYSQKEVQKTSEREREKRSCLIQFLWSLFCFFFNSFVLLQNWPD